MIILSEIKTGEGTLLGVLTLVFKNFKTGSKGWYAAGKIEIDGVRYQAQTQLVEIGSKDPAPAPEAAAESETK